MDKTLNHYYKKEIKKKLEKCGACDKSVYLMKYPYSFSYKLDFFFRLILSEYC